jgi:hypothetical protein
MRKQRSESKLKAQAEEYQAWRQKHELEHAQNMLKLAAKNKKADNKAFFEKKAKELEALRRDPPVSTGPKPNAPIRVVIKGIDTSDMTLEELEQIKKREEAAQEEIKLKKARTGPVYNKGSPVYLSDDLLKDVMAGNTRRRN